MKTWTNIYAEMMPPPMRHACSYKNRRRRRRRRRYEEINGFLCFKFNIDYRLAYLPT